MKKKEPKKVLVPHRKMQTSKNTGYTNWMMMMRDYGNTCESDNITIQPKSKNKELLALNGV